MLSKKFYLTTPIYYVNARPHIGHAYTTIVADVLARRRRLLGNDTLFLTGTDEHGQKIERSAFAAGIPPKQFADQVSKQFRDLWDRMGLTYDRYIRTTDEKHKQGVQKLFRELYSKGFIYVDSYTGSYCVSDEAFVDLPAGTACPDCGRPLETLTEENYFFKLSSFQEKLVSLIESNELLITPDSARNEVLRFVQGGLKDVSVSRSSISWGILVPEEAAVSSQNNHVIYVWFDALVNYMSAIGYGSESSEEEAEFARYWPADLQLVGKEITRFHCVYWPAFLMAAGIPTPKQITAHGWLLFDNAKMSKSRGNVVRAETILDGFGEIVYSKAFPESTKSERDLFASDVLRYFLLREVSFGQDGSFSFDAIVTRYNAELANGYGNLVSRTLKLIQQNRKSVIPARTDQNPRFRQTVITELERVVSASLEGCHFEVGLQAIMEFLGSVDQFITEVAPWKLAKDPARSVDLDNTLYDSAGAIRIITALLYPFIPASTAKVWAQLGLGDIEAAARNGELVNLEFGALKPGTKSSMLGAIFPRADRGLVQIMMDIEERDAKPTSSIPISPKQITSSEDLSRMTGSTSGPILRLEILEHQTSKLPGVDSSSVPSRQSSALPVDVSKAVEGQADASPPIAFEDFAKLELRVAQITAARRIPKAEKLLLLEIDLGDERRQILSGIAAWYMPEDLIGCRVVVVTNLAPRKILGFVSHGMLLTANSPENPKPFLATFEKGIPLGSRLK